MSATGSEQYWWRVDDFAETLIDAWRHVDGQMVKFPAALCKGIEKLHGDGSYVLLEGQR